MRTTHRIPAAIAACVALLALAGCGNDTKPPAPDFTPTGRIDTPSPSTSDTVPTEPTLPDAAKQPTEEGARAFTAYYWDLINYAQVTGDIGDLRRVSGPNCAECNAGIQGIRKIYKSGGYVTDGHYRPTVSDITPFPAKDKVAFKIKVVVNNDPHESVAADGTRSPYPAATAAYAVYELWTGTAWRLDVMEGQ